MKKLRGGVKIAVKEPYSDLDPYSDLERVNDDPNLVSDLKYFLILILD